MLYTYAMSKRPLFLIQEPCIFSQVSETMVSEFVSFQV